MAQVHARPGEVVHVRTLGPAQEDGLAQMGSTVILKFAQLELIRLVLPRRRRNHRVQGEITGQCLEGLVNLATPHATLCLVPGQLIQVRGGDTPSLVTLADSSTLLTICLQRSA